MQGVRGSSPLRSTKTPDEREVLRGSFRWRSPLGPCWGLFGASWVASIHNGSRRTTNNQGLCRTHKEYEHIRSFHVSASSLHRGPRGLSHRRRACRVSAALQRDDL